MMEEDTRRCRIQKKIKEVGEGDDVRVQGEMPCLELERKKGKRQVGERETERESMTSIKTQISYSIH